MTRDPAALIGQRIRTIRTSGDPYVTTAQLAQAASRQGLPWSDSRISALERGSVALTPAVLYVVAGALSDLLGRSITIADLIPDGAEFELTPQLHVSSEQLAAALRGEPVQLPPGGIDLEHLAWAVANKDRNAVASVLPDLTRVDLTVIDAASPDDRVTGLDACIRLWGIPPEMMRDQRAPEGANAQKLGRVTRELIEELTEAMRTKPWLRRNGGRFDE